ncbi:MAG: PEGA domain-containing protein [bacterium]
MELKEFWKGRTGRRPAVLVIVLVAAMSLGGCGWWEKTVVKPVKGFTDRRLTITSDPPGANIFVDNVFQGKTPITLNYKVNVRDLLKGFVVVVQKDGYLPVRREVTLQTKSVTFRLIRSKWKRQR